MQINLNLVPGDQERLLKIMKDISTASRFEQSLDDLIARWSSLTAEVEKGYNDSIYEYTNDLGTRDLLARINSELSEDGQNKLASMLAPLDDRFLLATIPLSQSIRAGKDELSAWWWYRAPRKLTEELKKDLVKEGVVKE